MVFQISEVAEKFLLHSHEYPASSLSPNSILSSSSRGIGKPWLLRRVPFMRKYFHFHTILWNNASKTSVSGEMHTVICIHSHIKRRLVRQIPLGSLDVPTEHSFVKCKAFSLIFMILWSLQKCNVFSGKMCDILQHIPDIKHSTVYFMPAALAGQLLLVQSLISDRVGWVLSSESSGPAAARCLLTFFSISDWLSSEELTCSCSSLCERVWGVKPWKPFKDFKSPAKTTEELGFLLFNSR